MAIKVTTGEAKPKASNHFPKLMRSSLGRIVLFVEHKKGIQINTACTEGPHYCENWAMGDFTDYNEPITIQNA